MTLQEFVEHYEKALRLGFFFGVLLVMSLWERAAPCRPPRISKPVRWLNTLGLVVVDTVVLRLLFPAAAVGVALWTAANGWGLFHNVSLGPWAAALLTIVAMDFVVWLTHVGMHAVPWLWRVHRMHHADLDYDAITGVRFHPIEIVLAMVIKSGAIIALGAPVAAIIAFEVLLNGTAMFNHGNVRLPGRVDRVLRRVLVTPDMHRVHHSTDRREQNRNFGFCLPWWDRLFRTYLDQPRDGQEHMAIGLLNQSDPRRVVSLVGLLRFPFTK